jgi:hypothetical protein
VGLETYADYSLRRTSGNLVTTDLSKASKAIVYESSFSERAFAADAAWGGETGFMLFGRRVNDSKTSCYLRKISAAGKPAAAAKKFPPNKAPNTCDYRIIPLTGTGWFATTWYDYSQGLMYLQKLSSKGTFMGSPVPISENAYRILDDVVDMTWDAASQRIFVAYAEYAAAPSTHDDIWVAIFSLE